MHDFLLEAKKNITKEKQKEKFKEVMKAKMIQHQLLNKQKTLIGGPSSQNDEAQDNEIEEIIENVDKETKNMTQFL